MGIAIFNISLNICTFYKLYIIYKGIQSLTNVLSDENEMKLKNYILDDISIVDGLDALKIIPFKATWSIKIFDTTKSYSEWFGSKCF